ncbi:MAG: PAS domain-containing protein, partial [Pseudomonadota bacterium]|nr:PAS domain-containing protein [Pseudomonadota bacterium]
GRKDEEGTRTDAASALATIMGALRARSGHDFSEYKEKTLVRRLQRRMQILQLDSPGAYIARFREQPEELDLLFRELLIGVTHFFRDPAAWGALASEVIHGLVADKTASDEIRVWVPGCATGQEAFSIAILIREAMDARHPRPKVQVFGTDIDERAIAVARAGRYRAPAAGLSAERAERWFSADGDGCCVVPEIREMCVFSTHSLVKHPPFSKLDLISCRNLLIYLDASMQDRVMRTFHYALKAGGRLFLGSSESVTRATGLFGAQDRKHRIFQRREVDGPSLPDISAGARRLEISPSQGAPATPSDDRIDKKARRVMEKYYPPHVVIDPHDQIVRFSGAGIGRYLEPAAGAPSFALHDILRKTLLPAVRTALKEVKAVKGPIRHENVPMRIDGLPRLVTLIAEPMAEHGAEAGFVVVAFQDAGAGPAGATAGRSEKVSSDATASLEQELRTTRAQLQSTIDELEITNEEMKSSNEEYQSVNEELQSSNEELETAKEEMQSINEEIQTINAEMVSKNEQLTILNSDQKNLFESTEIATLFLDEHLRVRNFTPGITDVFRLRETDIGRPIIEIAGRLDYGDLQHDVQTVLRKLAVVERQVTLKDAGMTFILRIRPYRTVDNVIDGVVLTFVDITQRQAAQNAVLASEARFRMLFEFIDEGFCVIEKVSTRPGEPSDFRYLVANPGFERQSGLRGVVGKTIREVAPGEAEEWFDIYDGVMATGKTIRFERDLVTQGRTLELFAFRVEDGVPRIAVIFLDVSQRKRHEEQQHLLLREMDHRVKNLFAVVGGVVSLSARSATTPADMACAIQGRLGALAAAHLLIRPRWAASDSAEHNTKLGDLIRAVLSPYFDPSRHGDDMRAVISGPEISIGGEAITSLALVLHELATNSAKYGAFSNPGGRVHISWV